MKADLMGPVEENEIICKERPLDYYIIGKLYPQKSDASDIVTSSSDDIGNLDEEMDDQISLCNGNNPSSVGITFTLASFAEALRIEIKTAKYILIDYIAAKEKKGFEEGVYLEKDLFWKREVINYEGKLDLKLLKDKQKIDIPICEGLVLSAILHKIYPDLSMTITASLINLFEDKGNYIEQLSNLV